MIYSYRHYIVGDKVQSARIQKPPQKGETDNIMNACLDDANFTYLDKNSVKWRSI
jgi:hypothetical protein